MRRLIFGILIIAAAALNGGCWYEVRGNEVWACDTLTASDGTVFSGCQFTGVTVQQ